MTARRSAAKPMACITVDFVHLLLPADDALKVVALLGQAVRAEMAWAESVSQEQYIVQPKLRVSYTSVRAEQIVMPPGAMPDAPAAAKPLRLK